MPQPTLGDVHVNRPLTNISVAYLQEAAGVEFVADRAFPAIPVENKSDLYWTYKRSDFNRDEMQKRGLSQESAGTGYNVDSTGTYSCDVWALHKDVDDQIRANSDSPLSPDRDATIFLTNKALIRRENQWASKYFQTGVWTNQMAGAAAVSSTQVVFWDNYATVKPDHRYPRGQDSNAPEQRRLHRQYRGVQPSRVRQAGGPSDVHRPHQIRPDRAESGHGNAPHHCRDPRTRRGPRDGRGVQHCRRRRGGIERIRRWFVAALFYRPKNPGLMAPSAGYTFNWTGLIGSTGGAGVRIKTFRMEQLASDRVEIDAAFDMHVVSPDCGFFFNNVLSAEPV